MAIALLKFAVGLALLVKGADLFVRGAASLARRLGVSEFVIGLTLVALGTSVPELASALAASFRGAGGLVLGTVIGANVANMLLIAGLAGAAAAVQTRREMIDRDGLIMLAVTAVFCLFAADGSLGRLEAGALLLVYAAYTIFLFTAKAGLEGQYGFRRFLGFFFRFEYVRLIRSALPGAGRGAGGRAAGENGAVPPGGSIARDLALMAASGAAIAFGADLFVGAAVHFAESLHVPAVVIGASVVSLGTTLPEMSVTLSAARRGFGGIALGNVLGSCIANIGLIVGAAGMIRPLAAARQGLPRLLVFLFLAALLLLAMIRSAWRIRRWEGALMLAAYGAYIAMLFIR
jgi:cation:H+ antiporter